MLAEAAAVRLRHGPVAGTATALAVRALTGSDEAALGTGEDPDGERWATRVLTTAVRDPGGGRLSSEDLRALSVGDRNALLLTLIAATYGARVQWVVACSVCGEELDAEVNLVELVGAAAGPRQEFAAVGCTLPTCGDLEAVAALPDSGEARRELLERCVGSWQSLNEESLAAVERLLAQADPLADIELLLCCPACDSEVSAELDPRAELAARLATPHQLIRDVHTLALAYGWTEPEVLALPRPHRSEYLALIADGEL